MEVVGGRDTLGDTIEWCLRFYRAIGKQPIHIRKEAPGHLANRLQAALWREAVSAVVTGLASVEDVDTAISAGPGLRWAVMGPHMTFHLGGGEGGIAHMLEQFKPAFESWWASMSTPELSAGDNASKSSMASRRKRAAAPWPTGSGARRGAAAAVGIEGWRRLMTLQLRAWRLRPTPMLGETIGRAFRSHGGPLGRPAGADVRQQGVRWTWAELAEKVDAFAAGLVAMGLKPGDRVGIWSPNNAEWIITQYRHRQGRR